MRAAKMELGKIEVEVEETKVCATPEQLFASDVFKEVLEKFNKMRVQNAEPSLSVDDIRSSYNSASALRNSVEPAVKNGGLRKLNNLIEDILEGIKMVDTERFVSTAELGSRLSGLITISADRRKFDVSNKHGAPDFFVHPANFSAIDAITQAELVLLERAAKKEEDFSETLRAILGKARPRNLANFLDDLKKEFAKSPDLTT